MGGAALGGTTAGITHDQLMVSGAANMTNGVLNASFASGYTPVAGDSFVVLDANSLSGTFATTNLPDLTPYSPTWTWTIDYDNAAGTATLRITGAPLPVKLLSFNGKAIDTYNRLQWKTASEVNFSHFEIEKMNANGVFVAMANQVALGGANGADYLFDDKNPYALSYYRLKMVDNDGSFEYANIVTLRHNITRFEVANVYPNPTSDKLTIVYTTKADNSTVTFKISDAIGRQVATENVSVEHGGHTQTIDLSKVTAGVYFLSIADDKSNRVVKRIVVTQ